MYHNRPTYALIDVNAFYCSCERLFRPDLKSTPIVALSNNDGCVIARTTEAKKLGVAMGDPYFKIKPLLKKHGIIAFSSNYALYGDISSRVQQTIESMVPRVEVYSIDESFADLTGIPEPLGDFARTIQSRVLQWTGMPVGIGIGHTKTLAKAAQHASKVYRLQTGGVVDLRADKAVKWLLERMPCQEVWGVGRRLTEHLASDGISTAWQLANANSTIIRRKYGVVLERTVRELQGQSCLDLQEAEPDRQTICTSRMFGSRITTKPAMQEAIASYMHRAAQKLRSQRSLTSVFRLGIRTSPFGDEPRYSNATTVVPPYPTDDVLLLTRLASKALDDIWKDGFRYSKAEILLMDLRKRGEYTQDLFTPSQPAKSDVLMRTIDMVNSRFGKNALRSARMPVEADWEMRRELMSPSYTTSINQLMRCSAN